MCRGSGASQKQKKLILFRNCFIELPWMGIDNIEFFMMTSRCLLRRKVEGFCLNGLARREEYIWRDRPLAILS